MYIATVSCKNSHCSYDGIRKSSFSSDAHAYHETLGSHSLHEPLLDQRVTEDDLRELDGNIIFVARAVLLDRGPDGDRRYGDVVPDELLWSPELGFQAEELAILTLVRRGRMLYITRRTSSVTFSNKFNTLSGWRSSTAFPRCGPSSFWYSTALPNPSLHFIFSSSVFFALNFSCVIFSTPAFFTVPFVERQ